MDCPPLTALPRQTPFASFARLLTFEKPLVSRRDLAWPSVKLLAPATGAAGFGGLLGAFTAGVLASRAAGCCWATAGMATATKAAAIKILRMRVPFMKKIGT